LNSSKKDNSNRKCKNVAGRTISYLNMTTIIIHSILDRHMKVAVNIRLHEYGHEQ